MSLLWESHRSWGTFGGQYQTKDHESALTPCRSLSSSDSEHEASAGSAALHNPIKDSDSATYSSIKLPWVNLWYREESTASFPLIKPTFTGELTKMCFPSCAQSPKSMAAMITGLSPQKQLHSLLLRLQFSLHHIPLFKNYSHYF